MDVTRQSQILATNGYVFPGIDSELIRTEVICEIEKSIIKKTINAFMNENNINTQIDKNKAFNININDNTMNLNIKKHILNLEVQACG